MLLNIFSNTPFRNYSSLAALVVLLLEYFTNFRSEYTHIWRARPTVVKYVYILSRYLGLIGQIVHHVLAHVFPYDVPMKPELCRVWYLFLFLVCTIILAALDLILLLRVYALYMYKKNAKVHVLSLPVILQFIIATVQMERVYRCHNFNAYCVRSTSVTNVVLSGGSLVLAHAALLVATIAKRNVAQGGAAVVRLVVREGSLIVSLLIGIVAAQASYAVVSQSSSPFAFFVWPTAIISVITCRIILNMNMLNIEEPQQRGWVDSTECGLSSVERSSGNRDEEI